MPLTGSEFMLSHYFQNVSSMETGKRVFSPTIEKCGMSWYLEAIRKDRFLAIFFHRCRPDQNTPWEIDVEIKLEVLSSKGKSRILDIEHTYTSTNESGVGKSAFITWSRLEEEFLVDDSFQLLAYVKIEKTTGIQKKKLRDFSKPHRNHTDGALIVEGQKFYISKGFLAKMSPYFRQLFFGNNADANKQENELPEVNAQDFQNFLEEVYGKDVIDEDTVVGILKLGRRFHWDSCIEKCVEFLVEESDKSYKEKLAIGSKYQLKDLINHCVMSLDTKDAIRAALPNNIDDIDPTAAKILLQKLSSLN